MNSLRCDCRNHEHGMVAHFCPNTATQEDGMCDFCRDGHWFSLEVVPRERRESGDEEVPA